jgi:hypothetical protein
MSRFSNMKLRTKIAVGATLGAAVLGGGGMLAFAYFTSTGAGTGNATVGSASHWTVAAAAPTGPALLPGFGTDTVTYTVTNPSSGHQGFNTTTAALTTDANGGVYDTVNHQYVDGCLATWFTVVNTAPAAADVPGGNSVSGSLTISLNNVNSAQDACQGLNPQVTISAS